MLVYPDYYNDFSCIAGACKHSCCVGWEIGIDSDTLELYNGIPGKFGVRLKSNITEDGCFKLGKNEKCPFLNKDNLCDIITTLGEEALCNICADHPRFVNYIGDRMEIGLGLCCEAAAKLILRKADKMKLAVSEDMENLSLEEEELISFRDECIWRLQQRNLPVSERFKSILGEIKVYSPEDIRKLLEPLERLDSGWDKYLDRISGIGDKLERWRTAFEQLAVYFLYRHFFDGEVYRAEDAVRFAWFGVCTVAMIFRGESMEEFEDIARCFSAEIEYSEENTEAIYKAICGKE